METVAALLHLPKPPYRVSPNPSREPDRQGTPQPGNIAGRESGFLCWDRDATILKKLLESFLLQPSRGSRACSVSRQWRYGAWLLFAFLTLAAAPALAQQPSAEEQFRRAVELHQAGKLEEAIPAYEAYVREYPDHVEARSNLGAAYARLGNSAKAIENYERALGLAPDNAAIRFNLGLAYHRMGQLRRAADELSRVLAAQSDNRNALLLLGDIYLRLGENQKVISLLSPHENQASGDRAFLYLLGTALIRDNQLQRGQAMVDRILREGESAEAHLLLGNAQMMAREFRSALAEFARAVELNPKLPTAHAMYARALMTTGDTERAQTEFRKELEINPTDFDANFYLGVLLKKDSQFEEAAAFLRRALETRPGAPEVRYQLGSLYVASGKVSEAQAILEALVRDEPEFVEAHVSLATVYYRLKRKADGDRHTAIVRELNAKRQAKEPGAQQAGDTAYRGPAMAVPSAEVRTPPDAKPAPAQPLAPATAATAPRAPASKPPPKLKVRPESFEALSAAANKAREAGGSDEAIELYTKALALRPSWAEGYWYLATLYYEADRYAEARDAFLRLTALKPKGGVGWAMLGLCQFQLKDYEPAYENLQRGRALGLPADSHLSVVARYHLALLLNRNGMHESALQLLYGLARTEKESPAIISAMGLSALRLPYLPAEIPADQVALVAEAGRPQYLAAVRQMPAALAAARELLARHQRAPNVHYSYGVLLLAGQPDEAIREFERELEISPQHVPARLQIAFEYLKRSEYDKALPHAEAAAKLAPDSFAARNALGRALLETGDLQRAIEELEMGVKLAPDSPETCYALARAYARAGRKEDAARMRAEFQRLDQQRQGRKGSGAAPAGPPSAEKKAPPA